MNLLPKTKEEFSQKEYWDAFFKKRGNKAFEWYGEYPELSGYLHKYIKPQDDILITGCGNSTLGKDLYDVGCRKVTNIDISNVVVRQMLSQNDKERPGLRYIQMDALNTTFKNEEFSVIIDKGTLDALMADSSEETNQKIDRYFSELKRIVRLGGRYICISLLQEHILNKLLSYFPSNDWTFRAVRCFESEVKSIEKGENPMPVFMVVCAKFKSLPRKLLEINLGSGDKMLKCEIIDEVASHIQSVQKAAFVCSSLKKSNISDESEISIDLYEQSNPLKPKYTVYVVEIPPEAKNSSYAAFIVPEGRETEWLFSTKAGRKNLVTMTNHNRLSIVTMHRGQIYKSLDAIQKELEDVICNLAPSNLKNKKIAFLTLGSDLGKRIIKYEGKSDYSGDYVVEDVEHDDGQKFRRLFFLSSQLVIQSEAKIKTIKSRAGKPKEIIDLATLTCQHHIYMSIAANLICYQTEQNPKIVVLGLGGGGLCSFLHKFIPSAMVTGIDIDPEILKIATEWFGFIQSDKLEAKIHDGLEFIRHLDKTGEQVDAIFCDVDSKNSEVGMSCPPIEFLALDLLQIVSKVITDKGLFVTNIVLRDHSLRPGILDKLKKIFRKVISYKLTEDLNEIFICTNLEEKDEYFRDGLKKSSQAIKAFFKRNNVKEDVEVVEYINSLKINRVLHNGKNKSESDTTTTDGEIILESDFEVESEGEESQGEDSGPVFQETINIQMDDYYAVY